MLEIFHKVKGCVCRVRSRSSSTSVITVYVTQHVGSSNQSSSGYRFIGSSCLVANIREAVTDTVKLLSIS